MAREIDFLILSSEPFESFFIRLRSFCVSPFPFVRATNWPTGARLGKSSEERGLSRKHIIESVRGSLERLQLDYIDVVLIHRADPMCPMEGPIKTFACFRPFPSSALRIERSKLRLALYFFLFYG